MEHETSAESSGSDRKGGRLRYVVGVVVVVLGGLVAWWGLGSGFSVPSETSDEPTADTIAPSAEEGVVSDIRPGERVIENGVTTTLVYLTTEGFLPEEVTITAGEEVRFINRTEGAMRVGARSNLSSPFYATVVQPDVVSYGGVYQVGLTRVGLWSYENLTSSDNRAQGVIFIR